MIHKTIKFAEKVLQELNETFTDDENYLEALSELIERATDMYNAKREEQEAEDKQK